MGGLASGLAQLAGKAADSLGGLLEHSMSIEHSLSRYPESKPLADTYLTEYAHPLQQGITEGLERAHQTYRPDIRERFLDPTNPNHPNNGKRINPATNQPLPDGEINVGKITRDAQALARANWLKKGDMLGVYAAKKLEANHGIAAANNFSDNIAFLLKDISTETKWQGKTPVGKRTLSTFKARVQDSGIKIKDTLPSYTPASDKERAVVNYLYSTFSPLIAVPHVSTWFNGLFGADTGTFLKASANSLHGAMRANPGWQGLLDSGAYSARLMDETRFYNKLVKSSGKAQLPEGSTQAILRKLFHQPGFNALRDRTLLSGAEAGRMTAEKISGQFAKNPTDKNLLWQVHEFGLDPKKLLAQGGALDKEDLNKAVFSFVDKHYFVDNTLQRSRLLQSSPIGRMLGMYHGYVTRQYKLMRKAMFQDWKERGTASVIRNLAIGATLFPMLGEGVKMTQALIEGRDTGTDIQDIGNFIKDPSLDTGEAAIEAYVGAMAHVGAFGVYAHMLRGAYTHNLAQNLAGPAIGAGAALGEDIISGSKKTYNDGDLENVGNNFLPMARDVSYDIPGVSLLAHILDHRLLPKANEDPDNDPAKKLYQMMNDDKIGADGLTDEQRKQLEKDREQEDQQIQQP